MFDFLGEVVSVVPTCGFFITMNPGYAGRTELPENLKALFRSCAMIRPDLRPICENMLMAEGFVKARALAVKFVTLYSLSSELLSKQVCVCARAHQPWLLCVDVSSCSLRSLSAECGKFSRLHCAWL